MRESPRLMVHQYRSTILFAVTSLLAVIVSARPVMSDEFHPPEKPVRGYIDVIPPETPESRAERHRKGEERRKKPCSMVHRGMSAAAPENTLEAYAAAMDYGADGCEIDLRRTADGALVLFHDDMLDRLTDGFGALSA